MIRKLLQPRHLAAAALAFVVATLGGCLAETGDSVDTASYVNLTEFVAEFLRSAFAAWVL